MFSQNEEIDSYDFDELGGFDAYEDSDWEEEEYFKSEDQAKQFADKLINRVKTDSYYNKF